MEAQTVRPAQHNLDSDIWTVPSENHSTTAFELTEPPTTATGIQDVAPDGGYGWVCTACVFLVNAHTWGINSVSSHYMSIAMLILVRLGQYSLLIILTRRHSQVPLISNMR